MKRTPLRKKSKSELRKAVDKADRSLQDWYRRHFPDDKCESCGGRAELRHHFIEKSRSTYLRFHKINLIALCSKCHTAHHLGHDSRVMARVVLKKGDMWLDELMGMASIHASLTQQLAEQKVEEYKN